MKKLFALSAAVILLLLFFWPNLESNFSDFQKRAKKSEARANLAGMVTAQNSYFHEWQAFSTSLTDLGFLPESRSTFAFGMNPKCKGAKDLNAAGAKFSFLFELLPCADKNNFYAAAIDASPPDLLTVAIADKTKIHISEFQFNDESTAVEKLKKILSTEFGVK